MNSKGAGGPLASDDIEYVEADDPYAQKPGDKIIVARNMRSTVLARLYARRHIDEAQHKAGLIFERLMEKSGLQGASAFDWTREQVDYTPDYGVGVLKKMTALDQLVTIRKEIGRKDFDLVWAVIGGYGAFARAGESDRVARYLTKRFKDALESIAVLYKFVTALPANVHINKVA